MKNDFIYEDLRSTINRILIVQTAFIGDVILITPLIRETKKLFPNSYVDVMIIPQASSLLENNPHINSVILFDKRNGKISAFIKTLRILRKNHYDIAISPHSSITTALLMFLSNIPNRIGFARWTSQIFLTKKIQHLKNRLKIKKNLHLLSTFTDQELSVQTELFPTDEMYMKATNLLSSIRSSSKKIVAIAPGSNWFTKRWPEKYYEELVIFLRANNYGIIFIGSAVEKPICERIKPEDNYLNLAGKLSLLESAAVISMCDLIVCNDSGAMHLANAMRTDVFVFFGPTVKRIGYFPIRESDVVFELDLECRPCSSHGTRDCELGHHNCMKLIKSEFVFENIQEKFK